MSKPLLSIVIPTYNRIGSLTPLLADLSAVLERHADLLQVVVCDNRSTDGTPTLIAQFVARWPDASKLIVREVNFGMEGNIACAMIEGDGHYIWMLSDHQRLCIPNVIDVIDRLGSLEFELGHAKLLQWSAALEHHDAVQRWDEIAPHRRGAFLFSLGNLSTMIFKRELALGAMKNIFRACVWSYPHLGIISRLDASSRIIEFDNMSVLPEGPSGTKLTHDYDKISVRFRSNIVCVELFAKTAGFTFDRKGFFTPEYRIAFRGDVLNFLRQPGVTRVGALKTLGPVIAVNPLRLKAIGIFVLLGILLVPASLRLRLASNVRELLMRRSPLNP